ncbi:MAG: HMA2 domain-containing protein [Pseudomonadota bacterium]
MIPHARVAHAVPGRLRLRIADRRGDDGYFAALTDVLGEVEGIRLLSVNPATASVLLTHRQGALEGLGARASAAGLFVLDLGEGTAQLAPESESMLASGLPALLPASERFDPRLAFALVLIGLAAHQMARGHVLAPAASLLWYAFQLLDRRARSDD